MTKVIERDDQEISLKGLIIKLWHGKWIIAAVTLLFVAVGALYVFVLAGRSYESRSVLQMLQDDEVGISAEVLAEQLKSDEMLALVADASAGNTQEIGDMISVSANNNSGRIELKVLAESPSEALQVSEIIITQFTSYATDWVNGQYTLLALQYEQEAEAAAADSSEYARDLEQYLQQNGHPESILAEAQALSIQSAAYQTQLSDANILILENETLLAGLYRLADEMGIVIEDKLETDVSSEEAEEAAAVISESGQITKSLLTTEITNTKTELLDAQAKAVALEEALRDTKAQADQKWLEYSESEIAYQLILSDYQRATETAYLQSNANKDALERANTDFGKESIDEVISAEQGVYTGPNVRNTLLFAAVAGLLLSGAYIAMSRKAGLLNRKPKRKTMES